MRMWWKVLIGLAVGLPMLAYVTGSLLASNAGSPPRPDPVVIQDASRPSTGATPTLRPEPVRSATPDDDDDDDDGERDDTPPGNLDDNGVEIVNPKPTGVDDDDDGNGDGDDDDDDRDSGGDDGDDDSRDGDD